jgi:hypothetical protein
MQINFLNVKDKVCVHPHCARRCLQFSTARRDCGRVGIALRFRRACSRSSSADPRAKGSSGRQVVSASALAAQGDCWPSGRSGAGWGRSQGLPWVGGGLGGALRHQGRRSSRGRLFRAYPPWAASPRSSAWRGGATQIRQKSRGIKNSRLCGIWA